MTKVGASGRGRALLAVVAIAATVPVVLPADVEAGAPWAPAATWTGVVNGANGIDIDPATGDVWVSSFSDGRLLKFDPDGNLLLATSSSGTGAGQVNGPGDVAVGAGGDVFMQDRGNHRISRFAADGTFVLSFGVGGSSSNPLGLAVDGAGDLYSADPGEDTVRRYSPNGALLQSYTGLGPDPFGIAIDPAGKLWVTTQGGTVRRADPATGAIELAFTIPGSQLPDIEFDAVGNAQIIDFNRQHLHTYTAAGELLETLQLPSSAFRLAVDPQDRLYVTAYSDIHVFAGATPPDDDDGVDPLVEDGAPNDGDGNGDGVADSLQSAVASLPTATGAGYVTVVGPAGSRLAAVTASALPDDPPPPPGVTFPLGLVGFEVLDVQPGSTVEVVVHVPGGTAPNSFWKLQGGSFVEFDGAAVDGDLVTLTLTDGGPFDADGVADGVIVDPIGLGDGSLPLDHIVVTPATAVVGVGQGGQLYSVAGFAADGSLLGDVTADATFAITPSGTCVSETCTPTATGPHTVTATVAGITATASIAARTAQTITFAGPTGKTLRQSPVTLSATASSQLAVSFTTLTPEVCAAGGTRGRTITLVTTGSCTVAAQQAGNATFAPAPPVQRTFAVVKAPQTISFPAVASTPITTATVNVSATASSGLSVTFASSTPEICTTSGANGSTVTLVSAGTCTVAATQGGDATWAAAAAARSFNVTKLAQTVTFVGPTAKSVLESPVAVAASASSGLPVTFTTTTPAVCTASGSSITLVGAGTCTVRAEQPGDGTWKPAAINRSFTVSKANQAISFGSITSPKSTETDQNFAVSATATSGLTVTFTSTTANVCTVQNGFGGGGYVRLLLAGTCTLRASQPGDAAYKAAPSVTQSFTVTQPPPDLHAVDTDGDQRLLPPAGGTIRLYASASNAVTCRFAISPAVAGFPKSVPCSTGSAFVDVALPANTGATGRNYTVTVAALRTGAPTATKTLVLRVAASGEPVADLAVTGASLLDPEFRGEQSTYTLTVANAGPDAATATRLDFGVFYGRVESISASAGSCTAPPSEPNLRTPVSCLLGSIPAGGSATVTVLTAEPSTIQGTVATSANDFNGSDNRIDHSSSAVEPWLVYTDDWTSQIYVMPSDPVSEDHWFAPRALTTTSGSKVDPVLSPDKRTVAFFRQNPATNQRELWLVGVDGIGERLLSASEARGVSWAPDSRSVITTIVSGGKEKAAVASAVGGPDLRLLIPDTTYGEAVPTFTQDGNSIIFRDTCYRPVPAQCRYHRIAADGSGTRVPYLDYGTGGGLVTDPDGEWFYFSSNSTIHRARIDGTSSEAIVTDLMASTTGWSLSPSGDRLAYSTVDAAGKIVIATVAVDGTNRRQLTTPMPGPAPAGCYSPTWNRLQTKVFMHCYPLGNATIGIASVDAGVTTPMAPEWRGGSFRSRNPDLAGWRPNS